MDEKNKQTSVGNKKSIWIVLHIILAFMSLSGVCTKMAASEKFLSLKWCMYYGTVLMILFIYALVWQQIIKRLPLTVAYANRAVSVLWGCVFGVIFFDEKITTGKIIGGILVALGVILFAISDRPDSDESEEGTENV